jgi:hypothetical protein
VLALPTKTPKGALRTRTALIIMGCIHGNEAPSFLITRRSKVQILPPQPIISSSHRHLASGA